MCTPECIIAMLGCPAVNEAVKAVTKARKYVRQYRMHVDNLRTELRHLEDARVIIERRVREARDRGEEIENAITHWQADAGQMENDVQELIGQVEARMHCFACSCPNIMWRYRLAKQAEEKIRDVQRLVEYNRHFEEISYPKPPPPELEFPSAENYVHLDSRTPIFEQIVVALKDPNVKTIGVHGLGGVGKTTLVEKVAKKLLDDRTFKQIPLVAVSKVLNVKEIQKKLADKLNLKLEATTDENAIAIQLWNKFKNDEQYLVILDDIWEVVDLKAIGIPITDGQRGCKVVLTSRNKDLLEIRMKTDTNFPIAELEEGEAWDLFKKQVGNSMESQPGVESLAREVCKKCKGLPVAIKALGGALEGKPSYMWANALVKLTRYMLTNIEDISSSVWATLRVSYDMLESTDAKSCFLLCCLFAEDIEISIDDLTRHCVARSLLSQNPRTLEEARDAIRTVVYILKSTSLLSNGSNENVVRIHDVIRYVGISIAREEQAFLVDHGALQWPRNLVNELSAISLNSGKIRVLPDGLVYPQLHTLILDNNELSDLEVPDKFFSGMKQLTVLILIRIRMRRLPSSLAKLSNLRMLCLNQCELADIAILRDLKTNLEVLSLRGSDIEALPPEMAQLTSLRVLDLRDCDDLKLIPQGIISNLTNLEELYFSNIFDTEEDTTDEEEYTTDEEEDTSVSRNVIEEIRLLLNTGQLTTLHIHIPVVTLLPKEDLMLENLKRFRISLGINSEWDKNFSETRVLQYEESSLRKEFIPLVDKANVLYLSGIKGLKKVLDYRGVGNEFLDLKYLKVESYDDDLEYLLGEPKSSVQNHGLYPFNHLTGLTVQNCKLKYLFSPTTARGLVHLEQLKVVSCKNIREIVGFERQNNENELIGEMKFSKLKQLKLKYLPKLINFYAGKEKTQATTGSCSTLAQPLFNEKVILPVLEELKVISLGSIEEIWDKQSPWVDQETASFSQLRDMTVESCTKLMNLVPSNMLPRLQNLKFLTVDHCPNVEFVVFKNGNEEEAANDSTLIIPRLTHLEICHMKKLKSFYSSSTTSHAQSLFNHQVIFPVLEELKIWKLDNIIEIWDKQSILVFEEQGSFCQLMTVDVEFFDKLTHLFPSKMHPLLKNLTDLEVGCCYTMEGVVGFEGEVNEDGLRNEQVCFSQLTSLCLRDLPKLVSFCTKMGEAGTTEGNPTIHAQPLFNGKVAFPALEYLTIIGMPKIEIWDKKPLPEPEQEIESFGKLATIDICICNQLVYVLPSYMLPRLQNLQELEIQLCEEVEVIVSKELMKEKEAVDNDPIVFSQLKAVKFSYLPNLKGFYTGTQLFFSKKVAFPALEELHMRKLPKITELWDKQPLPKPEKMPKSFYKLVSIHVEECDQLVYVFPSYMLPQLQNLVKLVILDCYGMEVIISNKLKENEATNNDIILLAKLKTVILQNLSNLKRLCAEMQLDFSNKDAFPVLEINIKEFTERIDWKLELCKESCIDPDLTFLVDGTSRKEIHSELKTREEKKNEMAVEHPMKIDSSFNNSSIQMNGSTDHVNSDFTLNRGSPSGSGSREAGNSGLRGLDNLGNTCFMNSAIQCLVHTSELVAHFKDHQKDVNTEESSGMKGELAFQFGDLVRKLRAPEAGPVSPEEFKSKLAAIDLRFNDGNQHDSQEFLAFLLNELHGDLNCATCKPIEAIDVEVCPNDADQSDKHCLSCNTSIIVDLFHGQYQSKLVCLVCKKKSSTFERFQDLSLPIPLTKSATITLDQCLQTYLQEEFLGPEDKWNCPNCKTDQQANKKLDLWRLPKILIIHLKRFSNNKDSNKKLETFVDFPIDDFDLSGIVRNSQQPHHYILYAVINHYGDMGGGHYTAFVQHGGDQWYEFDDSRVSPVAEHQIKSSAAYVLFYRRKADV